MQIDWAIIWHLNQNFKLKNQRNWLKQAWMLKFWSVINCFFMHWTKKLTLLYYFCCSKLFSFTYLFYFLSVLGIQQENRHIRQLQHENKELRAALEEHQNVLELIMSKYREHMSCFQNSTKIEKDLVSRENTKVRLFRLFLFV